MTPPRRRRGAVSREDLKLWAHVTRSVRPMAGRLPFALPEPLPEASSVSSPDPVPIVLERPSPTASRPLAAPLQPIERRLKQKLARGQREVDGVLDLHGMRQDAAHAALSAFILRGHREARTLVLIITGKGASGDTDREGRGVLRRMVPHWLTEAPLRRMIVGFEEAGRGHGGSGALYVRLRKPHRA